MLYPKIQTVYKRDPENKLRTLLEGEFSTPELEYLKDLSWDFTEKVDGTNIRLEIETADDGRIHVGGKTDRSHIPSPLLNWISRVLSLDLLLATFPDAESIKLFGEGYGKGIQGRGDLYGIEQTFVLFDAWVDGWWLERANVDDVAYKLGIESVPVIGTGTLEEMVELARGRFESTWRDFNAEGIVARPSVQLLDRSGDPVITKIKSKDFPNGQEKLPA